MGCGTSKQLQRQQRCRHCQRPYTPAAPHRSHSMAAQLDGERHFVSLTSSTVGSVKLDIDGDGEFGRGSEEFSRGVLEAKAWSLAMEVKFPTIAAKTPIETPPGEPESINAWELMEGLEDSSPLRRARLTRSFSFPQAPNHIPASSCTPSKSPANPCSLRSAVDAAVSIPEDIISERLISDLDPDVITTFRKALRELSPAKLSPVNSCRRKVDVSGPMSDDTRKGNGKREGDRRRSQVVVYVTSLRGVRKTYEDCCSVMVILRGLGFRVDDRDVSMHSELRQELRELVGGDGYGLPRVFAGGECIGGAEEVRRMHEEGRLGKALEGCETVEEGGVCEGCGGVRFVLCETCSGSCKVYCDWAAAEDGGGDGFRRCLDCNENGLRRCPICCD